TIENLREITEPQNKRNVTKSIHASSQYKGVSKCGKYWRCQLDFNGKVKRYCYQNELHAAYHYNLLLLETGLDEFVTLNEVEKPIDFVLRIHHIKTNDLPVGIQMRGKKFV